MRRLIAVLVLLSLSGCGSALVPLLSAGAGVLAGAAKLDEAALDWYLTVKRGTPGACALPAH